MKWIVVMRASAQIGSFCFSFVDWGSRERRRMKSNKCNKGRLLKSFSLSRFILLRTLVDRSIPFRFFSGHHHSPAHFGIRVAVAWLMESISFDVWRIANGKEQPIDGTSSNRINHRNDRSRTCFHCTIVSISHRGIPAKACVDVWTRMIRKRFVPIMINVWVNESRREGGI